MLDDDLFVDQIKFVLALLLKSVVLLKCPLLLLLLLAELNELLAIE